MKQYFRLKDLKILALGKTKLTQIQQLIEEPKEPNRKKVLYSLLEQNNLRQKIT